MKAIKLNFLTAILLLAACTSAQASLVGSSVTFSHAFSEDGGLFLISNEETIGVEAGNGDVYNFNDIYTVNPEAASYNIDFLSSGAWDPANFNGLYTFNIDSTLDLSGVDVDTNMADWNDSRIFFTTDRVHFNWESLAYSQDTFFNANFTFGPNQRPDLPPNAIPEPATLLLFGAPGIAMLMKNRKR